VASRTSIAPQRLALPRRSRAQGGGTAIAEPSSMGQFVETWKQIAGVLGRSERWCRYMGGSQPDPLPVLKIGGIVRLYLADLDVWIARRRAGNFVTAGPCGIRDSTSPLS
jgi:hypothetical protein